MLEEQKECANLQSLVARQRREMAVDVMRKMGVDAGNGQNRPPGKQHLRSRFDESRLPAMQDSEALRHRRIARNEPPIAEDEQR